jgi:hypothetical protein
MKASGHPGYDDDSQYPDDEPESCWHCEGEGGYHECGEDCCCCLDNEGGPDDQDWYPCPECGGTGYLR